MVEQTALIWAGTVALVATFWGLHVSVPAHKRGESSLRGIMAYGVGLLFWSLFAIHSSGYNIMLGSGVMASTSTFSFTVAGVIGALLCVLLLFDASARAIGFSV